jgi:hypothetical protein
MKKLKFTLLGFLTLFMSLLLSSCTEDEVDDIFGIEKTKETAISSPAGTTVSGNCGTYKGPTGDIQTDAFCQAAWSAKCSNNKVSLDENCKIYKSFKSINPNLPACPYCD